MIVLKGSDSISSPTIHMSRFQSEKHNVTRLNSYKDTRYGSVTEPIGTPRGIRKSGKSRMGRGGFGGLRLEGKRKTHGKLL